MKIKGNGVRVDYAGDYISSIFDTEIKTVLHRGCKLSDIISKLENGHATFICGSYSPERGHYYIQK
jgi:hypothetical protein